MGGSLRLRVLLKRMSTCLHLWTKVFGARIEWFYIKWIIKWFQWTSRIWIFGVGFKSIVCFRLNFQCKSTVKMARGPINKQGSSHNTKGKKVRPHMGIGGWTWERGWGGRVLSIFGMQEGVMFNFSSREGRKKPNVLPPLSNFSTPHPLLANYCTVRS